MISPEREDEMYSWWLSENNDEISEEWRDDLTPEEERLVAVWDARYISGVEQMMARIGELAIRREQAEQETDDGWNDYPEDELDHYDADEDEGGE